MKTARGHTVYQRVGIFRRRTFYLVSCDLCEWKSWDASNSKVWDRLGVHQWAVHREEIEDQLDEQERRMSEEEAGEH